VKEANIPRAVDGTGECLLLEEKTPCHMKIGNRIKWRTSMRDNAKIVITEHGISPTLLLGSLPVDVSSLSAKRNGEKESKST
jgi:hypothetical protein